MSNLVPDGWQKTELSNYIDIGRGYAFKSHDYRPYGTSVVRVTNILGDGRLNLTNNVVYIDSNEVVNYQAYVLEADDILIVMVGATVGKLCKVEKKYSGSLLNQNMWRLTVKSDQEDSQKFAYYAINPVVEKFLSSQQGSASGFLTQKDFSLATIKLPPKDEQQKIAKILTSVDEVIEKTQAQIDKLKDLKTGMMQELLTSGINHTKFKDSPVGRIPAMWEVVKMDSICTKITDGEHQTPKRTSEGYFLLSARNIRDGYIALHNVDFVPEIEYQRTSKRVLPKQGDILISCSGSIGRVAVVPENLKFSMVRSVAILQPKQDLINSQFLAYQVSSTKIQAQIEKSLSQSAQANLFQAPIKALDVLIPPLREQSKIANIVKSIDGDIRYKSRKLDAVKNMKKALMQDLLTGKVRVKTESTNTEVAVG
jgi:type I restriction enzyme S subunit